MGRGKTAPLEIFSGRAKTISKSPKTPSFGHNAALACHMANESYFRKAAVTWDAASTKSKSY